MTIESSIAYFIAVILFAITPGPGVFAVIATVINGWLAELLTYAAWYYY